MATGSLDKIIDLQMGDLVSIMRLSCTAVAVRTVTMTPRLSGSLANSWNPNNGPPIGKNVTISVANPRPPRLTRIYQVVNNLKVGDHFSLSNGQPYARKIEYEGHSKVKRPEGMLRVSVALWQDDVRRAVQRGR